MSLTQITESVKQGNDNKVPISAYATIIVIQNTT